MAAGDPSPNIRHSRPTGTLNRADSGHSHQKSDHPIPWSRPRMVKKFHLLALFPRCFRNWASQVFPWEGGQVGRVWVPLGPFWGQDCPLALSHLMRRSRR